MSVHELASPGVECIVWLPQSISGSLRRRRAPLSYVEGLLWPPLPPVLPLLRGDDKNFSLSGARAHLLATSRYFRRLSMILFEGSMARAFS